MRVLGLIPARGGSKGIPRKNIRSLCGKPLLAYTADAALAAKRLAKIVLSTDDEEIAAVGRRCGLEHVVMRPAELARDETPSLPVVQHAIGRLEAAGERFDVVCLLEPTSPLRTPADIDACLKLLHDTRADTVVTIAPVPDKYHPHRVYFAESDGTLRMSIGDAKPVLRRQDRRPAFFREGSIYATLCDVIVHQNSLYGERIVGHLIDESRSISIDTLQDWERTEAILQSRLSE